MNILLCNIITLYMHNIKAFHFQKLTFIAAY